MPPLRDLALTAFVFGAVPYMWKRPYLGLLMWLWLSIMNPHRQTFGFAYEMPFAQVVAVVTLTSVLFHNKSLYRFPVNGVTIAMVFFVAWICVSPLFSFHPEGEFALWMRAVKIQLMVLVAFLVVGSRDELHKLTWVLALSIGYYGIKGGLFTMINGGHFKVWGPEGTFIGDNNSVALAIVMAVPLFRYLQLQSTAKWLKFACVAAMVLCTMSAVGSYSRGALVALLAMLCFLWMKGSNKIALGVIVPAFAALAFLVMPEQWLERMGTIFTYEEDGSAMGRINAWKMTFNLASSRIPIGGGFDIYTPDLFARFSPNPEDIHAAHSIYFQVLGEHGFMGLFVFVAIFGLAWQSGNWVIARCKRRSDLEWARDLASMCQVSLIGYAVGGAFLSLTYYDFPYYLVVMLVVLREIVRADLAGQQAQRAAPASPTQRLPQPTQVAQP